MKTQKTLALIVMCALCISMLAGCSNTSNNTSVDSGASVSSGLNSAPSEISEASNSDISTDPLEMITQGIYSFGYEVEGMDDMVCFFHFYEEQPVIGKVFYAAFAWNQVTYAGIYDVEEKEYSYKCFPDRATSVDESATPIEGTAPYTITFYDFEGNVLDQCGFDGKIMYNDMESITGAGDGNVYYNLDAQGEASSYYDVYSNEVGVAYLNLVAEDPTSTLTLYHNGKYLDMVNMMVEGTWTMSEDAEGYDITLTPEIESDTAAVLSVSGDMATATYTPDEGDAVKMTNVSNSSSKAPLMIMSGNVPVEGAEADIIGNMYEDGTVTLIISAYGQEMELDNGTYTMAEDGYTITFQFDTAGELVSSLGEEGATLQYVQVGSIVGDIDTQLVISLNE